MNRPLRAHDYAPPTFSEDGNVLTVAEVARELRCSKAHVHNIIHGKVPDLPPLPVLRIGRRVLIRHEGLKAWMLTVEAREIEAQRLTGLYR
ncbi:MAG: helix-turn-helix domain-containing protein [Acidobacteriia bacterium]|nr:helix-turn-helix domain-containing protein [Terriglobia bacterium]